MTTETKTEATPLPWELNDCTIETTAKPWTVIGRTYGEDESAGVNDEATATANAALIVRSVNAMPACIAAMESALDELADAGGESASAFEHGDTVTMRRADSRCDAIHQQLRDALAAAKGE